MASILERNQLKISLLLPQLRQVIELRDSQAYDGK
jgi:hypothetical protein